MAKLLEQISGEEALNILRLLSAQDQNIENRIEELAKNILKDVDLEEVSEEVFFDLDIIDVHDLWDQSGARSNGEYTSTEEMAYEMIENEIKPHINNFIRLHKSGLKSASISYCMGLLKGIYLYSNESSSEFKDWTADIPEEFFRQILEEWKKFKLGKNASLKMKSFLNDECNKWAAWALKYLA
ncbi:MAG: hypothetical protein KJP23_19705 [Deltaproteobacteria bacterium]|nr:hypothetical protein [Deltaproteobacteria bacterium]